MIDFKLLMNIVAIVFTLGSFALLFKIAKKDEMSFGLQLLLGLGLALGLGLVIMLIVGIQSGNMNIFSPAALEYLPTVFKGEDGKTAGFALQALGFVASLFTSLMKALIVPLVFFSVLKVVISKQNKGSGKVIMYTIIGFVLMVAVSSIISIVISMVADLGKGIDLTQFESAVAGSEGLKTKAELAQSYSVFGLLASFLPTNIIADMAANKMIPVIIFVFLLGYGLNRAAATHTKGVETVRDVVEAIHGALAVLIDEILGILPYSIFAMMFAIMLKSDFASIAVLFKYVIVVIVATILVFIGQLLIVLFCGKSPIAYLKNVSPALLVALTTASSNATLPVSIKSLSDNQKVSESVSNIVPTFGTMMGMAGCGAIFPTVLTILTMNSLGMEINAMVIIQIIAIVCLSSFGMQGVPGTASYAATLVLSTFGLPLTSIILVTPIDFFIDMLRTALNVNGALSVAVAVDKAVGDKE